MKIFLFLLIMPWHLSVKAQNELVKFIRCSEISWAANVSDTFQTSGFNMNAYLRNQLVAGKLKAIAPAELTDPLNKTSLNADAIRKRVNPNWEAANGAGDPLLSEQSFDSITGNLLEAAQVLYIQDGLIRTYTPWISPKYKVVTSWGQTLGLSNAFSTSLRSKRKIKRSVARNALPIAQKTIHLSMQKDSVRMLKQLYEQNLAEALWPHLQNKHYKIIATQTGASLPVGEIDYRLVDTAATKLPVYDVAGNPVAGAEAYSPLPLSMVSSIDVAQTWFYNKKKNLVYATITSLGVNIQSQAADSSRQVLTIVVQ